MSVEYNRIVLRGLAGLLALIALTDLFCGRGTDSLVWTCGQQGSAHYRGMAVGSGGAVWIGGTESTVLHSTDSGRTWQHFKPVEENRDFRSIHCWDDGSACVMNAGSPVVIMKTADHGQTWTETYSDSDPRSFMNGIAFSDSLGLAFGDPINGHFMLLRTLDLGNHWVRDFIEYPEALPTEAGFAASGSGIACLGDHFWFGTGGPAARVFHSTDRGRSWTAAATPMSSGAPSRGIFSIAFLDDKTGIAVGGDYLDPDECTGTTVYTTDGGKTWKSARIPPSGFRSCVVFTDKNGRAIAVGSNGSDITRDAGVTWKKADSLGHHTLRMGSKSTGFAAGSNGRISKLLFNDGPTAESKPDQRTD